MQAEGGSPLIKFSTAHHEQLFHRYLPKASDGLRKAARDIIDRRAISVHSYKDVPVAEKFWHSGDHHNRSWRFSLHSFALLDALMATGAWGDIAPLVQEWSAEYGTPKSTDLGDFPWHDHATALRLDRLSIMSIAENGPDFPELARQHAHVLLDERFYSKHTNHGYDQALALMLASYAFRSHLDTSEWCKVGLERLTDELRFAFNSEGVHVENSPAYHVGMTANLLRARFVKALVGVRTDFDFDDLLNKALLFTAWITGPDRKLAMMGDSTNRGGAPSTELATLPNYQHALYSASGGARGTPLHDKAAVFEHAGYGVFRSSWDTWEDHVHLVMKCGFISRYHRQDDDLNILLQGYGEHWLIDSGLYNHNQKDPVRIYMRSALAHNVPFIRNCPVSRTPPPPERASTLTLDTSEKSEATFKGTSYMYQDAVLSRTVVVEDKDSFQISDTVRHKTPDPGTFFQFHVPMNKRVRVSPHMARILGRQKQLTIRVASGSVGECRLYSGLDQEFKSAFSPQVNQCQPSQVIVFGPLDGTRIRFSLRFEDI